MNFALVIVDSLSAPKIRSVLLSFLAVVAGIIIYLAAAPSGGTTPAAADAVAVTPLVRAAAIDPSPPDTPAPNVVRVPAEGLSRPIATPVLPPDRNSLVRELQKALAQAGCYDGPITGIWSDAAKDAMRGFVSAVNAQLPVDNPDQSLVALVESNDGARCTHGRVVNTGALNAQPTSEAPPVAEPSARLIASRPSTSADPAPAAAASTSVDETSVDGGRSMIDRPWAPAGMLVPPKDMTAPETTPGPQTAVQAPAASQPETQTRTQTEAVARAAVDSQEQEPAQQPDPAAGIHFENNRMVVVPDPHAAAMAAAAAAPAQPEAGAATGTSLKTAQNKPKSKKRRPADEDMQTTISKGFYSLQKQWSSMF